MASSVARLHIVEGGKLWKDYLKQTAALQFHETDGGTRREHDFVKLVDDTLGADDAYAFAVSPEGCEGLFFNLETKLRGKAHATHHAQRVVAESDVGVEGCGDDAVLEVKQAVERVDEFAKACLVEAYRHGIDGEVAAVLVVFKGTVLHDGFSRVVAVAFTPCTHKFQFLSVPLYLCGAEIAEQGKVSLSPAKAFGNGRCHVNARAHDHHVDVVGGTLEEEVAHVAAHEVALHAQGVGGIANE